ncbi:MAG: agmatinase [Acidobacteria bacterium]|nr:agmatinase [Acidobacteriota bacterium]
MSQLSVRDAPGMPVIVGIPFDGNSSYLRGAAGAPNAIRSALHSTSGNYWTESGVDLGTESAFQDAGNLRLTEAAFTTIEDTVAELVDRRMRPVCLGGDHSITLPIARAIGKRVPELTLIHFDAHPDLYDEFEGNRLSHACPFARIMEEGRAKRLIQLGIRTLTGHQREQAVRFGVEIIEMRQVPALERLKVSGPVYISFDMDVLDPAFAPGLSHREPGGMSVREALAHLNAISGGIVGADLVEFNPAQDVSNLTAAVAAKLLKELLGKMLTEKPAQNGWTPGIRL